MRKLTPKQRKFVDEYVKTGNATKAALGAGYSKNYAMAQSSKMLVNVGIKTAIDEQMKKLESSKIAKADEVLQFLTSVIRGEAKETIVVGGMGGADTVEREADIKTKITAGKELLKRYPADDAVLQAQLKKLQAEADIAQAKADILTSANGQEGTVIIDDIPDD
ncbi:MULTISPECIES: terminase small subunit [Lacticaseibacillus]|uniref:Terminase small subunit n=1 Tax=Lacticaseibacillus hegangensis TaxID=2486010 RepID=A0ABW4CZD6_9LACO|nr:MULTISPECIES: terminase small subunit [Lacticaseibacillus]